MKLMVTGSFRKNGVRVRVRMCMRERASENGSGRRVGMTPA